MEKIPYDKFSEALAAAFSGADVSTPEGILRSILDWGDQYFENDVLPKIMRNFHRNAQISAMLTGGDPVMPTSFAMTGLHVGFDMARNAYKDNINRILSEARDISELSKRETHIVVELSKLT